MTKEEETTARNPKKKRVTIELTNPESEKKITVDAPRDIVPGFFRTYLELHFGIPPLNVSPVDWKGLVTILAPFILLVLINWSAFALIGILIGIGVLVDNYFITKNYYRDYIRSRLREGWQLTDSSQQELLHSSGVLPDAPEDRRKKVLYGRIAFYTLSLILILGLAFSGEPNVDGDVDVVNIVRHGHFDDLPSMPIGEAANNHMSDVHWMEYPVGTSHYVHMYGMVEYEGEMFNADFEFLVNPRSQSFVLEKVQIGTESEEGYYAFIVLAGLLYPDID